MTISTVFSYLKWFIWSNLYLNINLDADLWWPDDNGSMKYTIASILETSKISNFLLHLYQKLWLLRAPWIRKIWASNYAHLFWLLLGAFKNFMIWISKGLTLISKFELFVYFLSVYQQILSLLIVQEQWHGPYHTWSWCISSKYCFWSSIYHSCGIIVSILIFFKLYPTLKSMH